MLIRPFPCQRLLLPKSKPVKYRQMLIALVYLLKLLLDDGAIVSPQFYRKVEGRMACIRN